jgi:hypothetical protein
MASYGQEAGPPFVEVAKGRCENAETDQGAAEAPVAQPVAPYCLKTRKGKQYEHDNRSADHIAGPRPYRPDIER